MQKLGKIRRIFLYHWEAYLIHCQANFIRVRDVEMANVMKMLCCRTPLFGEHTYRCPECGLTRSIPHSCKSRFCSVCGYLATDNWIRTRFGFLLNCSYQHVVVTIPHTFNWMIKKDRVTTLNLYIKCIIETIQEYSKPRGYEHGIVLFFHSFGKNLQFHPHFHLLVSVGGLRPNGNWYYTNKGLPPQILMPRFKKKFSDGMKELFKTGVLKTKAPIARVLKQINNAYDGHWQFYVKCITSRKVTTMTYCVRYAKKMILSESRMVGYDGKMVEFFAGSDERGMPRIVGYKVLDFIRIVTQHIPEKHFKLIRYYGFYANRSQHKYLQARRWWSPLQLPKDKLKWRHRQWYRDHRDPLTCPNCLIEMLLAKVTFPQYRKMADFENIKIANDIAIQQKITLDYG